MRIAFWGTPDFAAPTLRAILEEGFDVVAVVTQPDRAVKRSRSNLVQSPVKEIALAEDLPVLQPESARDRDFADQLKATGPDISVVVAYGHILPRALIEMPRLGTLNVHASLLPKLRGAAPIQAAILQGLTETGVTIMRMVPQLDAGPIVLQETTPVLADETAGELQLRLSEMGAQALVEALALSSVGLLEETPQDDAQASYAPKIDRDMARIDWGTPADRVARQIRAFDPNPGAFSLLRDHDVKLFGARAESTPPGEPGRIVAVDDSGILVACGQNAVRISEVHAAGRRRMAAKDWVAGRGCAPGDRFDPGPSVS